MLYALGNILTLFIVVIMKYFVCLRHAYLLLTSANWTRIGQDALQKEMTQ